MNLTLAQKGLVLVLVPLAFQLGFVALVIQSQSTQVEDARWAAHTKEVIAQTHEVRSVVLDAHASVRGYVIARDPAFAAPYRRAARDLPELLDALDALVGDNPDQRARVRDDPSLVPNLVEEVLRLATPTASMFRKTTRDTVLGGVSIPAGSMLLLRFASANRDETHFPEPDRFDVGRSNAAEHLAFGHGIHFCIGAALARLEGRIGLEETLRRFPEWGADPAAATRVHTSTVRGYSSVPITL